MRRPFIRQLEHHPLRRCGRADQPAFVAAAYASLRRRVHRPVDNSARAIVAEVDLPSASARFGTDRSGNVLSFAATPGKPPRIEGLDVPQWGESKAWPDLCACAHLDTSAGTWRSPMRGPVLIEGNALPSLRLPYYRRFSPSTGRASWPRAARCPSSW